MQFNSLERLRCGMVEVHMLWHEWVTQVPVSTFNKNVKKGQKPVVKRGKSVNKTSTHNWLTTQSRLSHPVVPSCWSWWSYNCSRTANCSRLPTMVATSCNGEAGRGNRVTAGSHAHKHTHTQKQTLKPGIHQKKHNCTNHLTRPQRVNERALW